MLKGFTAKSKKNNRKFLVLFVTFKFGKLQSVLKNFWRFNT